MTPAALRPAPADSEFCFQLHKAAMRDYITAIWGGTSSASGTSMPAPSIPAAGRSSPATSAPERHSQRLIHRSWQLLSTPGPPPHTWPRPLCKCCQLATRRVESSWPGPPGAAAGGRSGEGVVHRRVIPLRDEAIGRPKGQRYHRVAPVAVVPSHGPGRAPALNPVGQVGGGIAQVG